MEEPFGPPPKEYNYRCSVCGTELLVNEAIIDAGIGMSKFNVKEFQTHRKWVPKMRFVTVCGSRFLIFGFKSWKRYSFPCWSV